MYQIYTEAIGEYQSLEKRVARECFCLVSFQKPRLASTHLVSKPNVCFISIVNTNADRTLVVSLNLMNLVQTLVITSGLLVGFLHHEGTE
jgi:hypothetical protein